MEIAEDPKMTVPRMPDWRFAPVAASLVVAGLVSGCSLGPTMVPSTTPLPAPRTSPLAHGTKASFPEVALPFETGALQSPPAYPHCWSDGHSVVIEETLGLDRVVLTILGIRAGESVSFGYAHPTTNGVHGTLTDAGPQLSAALSATLISGYGGHLSVARNGESGQAAMAFAQNTLSGPRIWYVSGRWSCAGPATVGSANKVVPATLPPAFKLPVLGLCSAPLTGSSVGALDPITCSNGALNVLAWDAAAALDSALLALGRHASQSAVNSELCQPVMQATSLAQAESVYEVAKTYNGWGALSNVDTVLASPGCL